jgi:hypothetical protein
MSAAPTDALTVGPMYSFSSDLNVVTIRTLDMAEYETVARLLALKLLK